MRTAFAAIAALALAGCGAPPTAPAPPVNQPSGAAAGLRVLADPVIDMTAGETRVLRVQERDATGAVLTRPPSAYHWISSSGQVVHVDGEGVAHAVGAFGSAEITVRSPDALTATVHVWVQPPQDAPSTYRITLVFSPNIPRGWHAQFEAAARRWERIIRLSLPPVALKGDELALCGHDPAQPAIPAFTGVETGTVIYVARRSTAGPATGQVCLQRPLPFPTSVVGRITIGTDPEWNPIILPAHLAPHEIGHALGLVGAAGVAPFLDRQSGRYTGRFALEGYRRQHGSVEAFLTASGGHWAFPGDLMGSISPLNIITKATVGALMDLGYPAAWYGAEQ